MAKEPERSDYSAAVCAYVDSIADHQVTQVELDMQRDPDRFPEYTQASAWLEAEETDLIQKLSGDAMAVEDFLNACIAKCAALAIETYKRGVLDGGRIYHAFVARELPKGGEADTE